MFMAKWLFKIVDNVTETIFVANTTRQDLDLEQPTECSFYLNYSDVIMGAMAFQITGVSIVYSTVFFQAQIQENIKAPRHWLLWGEFTG